MRTEPYKTYNCTLALPKTLNHGQRHGFLDLADTGQRPAANHPPEVHQGAENALDEVDQQHVEHRIVLVRKGHVLSIVDRPHYVTRDRNVGQHERCGERHR